MKIHVTIFLFSRSSHELHGSKPNPFLHRQHHDGIQCYIGGAFGLPGLYTGGRWVPGQYPLLGWRCPSVLHGLHGTYREHHFGYHPLKVSLKSVANEVPIYSSISRFSSTFVWLIKTTSPCFLLLLFNMALDVKTITLTGLPVWCGCNNLRAILSFTMQFTPEKSSRDPVPSYERPYESTRYSGSLDLCDSSDTFWPCGPIWTWYDWQATREDFLHLLPDIFMENGTFPDGNIHYFRQVTTHREFEARWHTFGLVNGGTGHWGDGWMDICVLIFFKGGNC